MKKIIGLVMMVVMAICLMGFHIGNASSVEYKFSAGDFIIDVSTNHGKNCLESLLECTKFYKDKRIEIDACILFNARAVIAQMYGEKVAEEKCQYADVIIGDRVMDRYRFLLKLKARDYNDFESLKVGDKVKISGVLDDVKYGTTDGWDVLEICLVDGVLVK